MRRISLRKGIIHREQYSERQSPFTQKRELLDNGDRLTQPEFHRRYLAYPEESNSARWENRLHSAHDSDSQSLSNSKSRGPEGYHQDISSRACPAKKARQ